MAAGDRTDGAAWEAEMFRLLAENVRDYALFLLDPQGHVLRWSGSAQRLLGYTQAEIVGQPCDGLFTPEDVHEGVPQREREQALAAGRIEEERWYRRRDGTRLWALGIVTPQHDPQGRPSGFVVILRDLTAWKRTDEASRERQRQLQLVADNAPMLIAHCGCDLRYKFVNKPFAARFGLQPADILGRTIPEVLGTAAFDRIRPHVEAALAGQRVEFEADVPYEGLGTLAMRVAYEPEWDASGRVVGFVAAVQNITDRKRAEAQLAASQRRLQALFDTSLDAFLLADDEANYVDANPAACALLGYDRDELLQRGVFDITPASNGEMGRAAWKAFIRDGQQSGEYAVRRKDGSTAVVEYRAVANVVPGLHLSVVRDVSERKRAGEVLRESEERLRTLSDNLPLGAVYQVAGDAEGRRQFLYISAGIERLIGVSPAEVMADAMALYGLIHEEDRHRVQLAEQIALRDHTPFDCEFRMRTRSEEVLWVQARSAPRTLPSGGMVWEGIVMDTTARKRAEEALFQERELLSTIIDRIPVMLTVYEPDAKVLRLNPAFERTLGWSSNDAADVSLMERCYPDPAYRERVRQFMQSCREGWMDIRMRTRDGRDLETSWANVRLSSGTQVGIGIDITDRKRYEQSLQDADRRKDEFLAMLGHELRNPLAPIRNAAQVIRLLSPSDPNVRRSTEVIERQVEHMSRLVEDLLDVSRITRGKITLQKEPVELAAVLARAVETARPLIDARRHRLTVTLPSTVLRVNADPTRLAQVVANLLTNAAKYTEEGGHITLGVESDADTATIRVRDTGVGIPREMLSRVFELFTQVERSLARSEGGLGIGLTLVKNLVELHGGTVEAHSDGPGRGSEFVVRLPVLSLPHAANAGEGERTRSLAVPSRRILVVDDNVDAAQSLAMLLQVSGHEVRTAHDGPTALQLAQTWPPQAVLLDIGLPRMDGYEVARRLRQQPAMENALLVALTGYGQEEDRRRALEAGFNAHLVKPADADELRHLLARSAPAS